MAQLKYTVLLHYKISWSKHGASSWRFQWNSGTTIFGVSSSQCALGQGYTDVLIPRQEKEASDLIHVIIQCVKLVKDKTLKYLSLQIIWITVLTS